MKKKQAPDYVKAAEKISEYGIDSSTLTHDETLRGSALALACKYYVETIIKDGDLYREMVRDNRVLKPATYMGVIEVAFNFESFLSGELKKDLAAITGESKVIAKAREELEKEAEKPIQPQE